MKNVWNDFVKPIVVLGVICLVASALLAGTNGLTAPIIQANTERTANANRTELLPEADTFTKVECTVEGVTEAYKADNGAGYVITAASKGYGGDVPVMVAFNSEGTITAVKFLDNDETPGLGQKVKNEDFSGQFAGREAQEMTLEDIDAISGATMSSRAAVNGINSAIEAYNVLSGNSEGKTELTADKIRAAVLPDAGELTPVELDAPGVTEAYKGSNYGYLIYVEGVGYHDKPMYAAVGFDDDGVITGLWTDGMGEGEPVREAFTGLGLADQLIGKTDASEFDGVAGATMSSDLMRKTIQMAVDAFQLVKEA